MTDHIEIPTAPIAAVSDPGEKDRGEQTFIDRIVIHMSNATAWLFPVLMIAITSQVVLRKAGYNQAWLDDAQWWLYGFAMTVGFAYAITTQSHVRVDILHYHFSAAKKAKIEIFGLGWLLLPFLAIMTDILFHYGMTSFTAREGSSSPNGLHHLYVLKLSLPALFTLAMLATISMVTRHLKTFTSVQLWTFLIGIFPAAWFMAERLCFYGLWWFVRATNDEIVPRRIASEPLLEPAKWYGLALVLAAMIISFCLTRRTQKG